MEQWFSIVFPAVSINIEKRESRNGLDSRLEPYRSIGDLCQPVFEQWYLVCATGAAYIMESRDATKDATPATIIVALASLDPVPPEKVPTPGEVILAVVSVVRQRLFAI